MAYRIEQFACAFTTRMRPPERAEVEALLSPDELALFDSMRKPTALHSLRVFRRLRDQCGDDSSLLSAALLHDVGKGRVTIAHKVAIVLLGVVSPVMLDRISRTDRPGWRRGFYQHRHHSEAGAEMARVAGSQPRVVDLIRYHHADTRQGPPGLAMLRVADEAS